MQCLVIDDMHPDLGERLMALGLGMTYKPGLSKSELLVELPEYDILICRTRIFLDDEVFGIAPRLKVVVRAGAGLDDIDLEAASYRNITVINAPEGNRDAVAEHTIGLTLALLNKISNADTSVKDFFWLREQHRGNEIYQKTVSIIGYGNMGRATAQRLSGFGCKLQAYDKYNPATGADVAQPVSLEQVFEDTDILLVHTPLTKETKGWLDYGFWSRFRRPIWFVNTARGQIVHHNDLLKALQDGLVKGAALDVLENEKFDRLSAEQKQTLEALMATGKVIFTPHVAGWTYESYQRINEVVCTKLGLWLTMNGH